MSGAMPRASPRSVGALTLGLPLHPCDNRQLEKKHASFVAQYEDHAARHWDNFYQVNQRRFFKDRHYLDREFPCLLQKGLIMLELGCGVGNTSLPVAKANPTFHHIYSCDYSATAVRLLQTNTDFQHDRMTSFVADITKDDLTEHVPLACLDVATCIFVLSANSPQSLTSVVQQLKQLMRPGTGTVVVRDYAEGDLAEHRLNRHGARRKLADNFYIRGDGTRCYYFSKEILCRLFEDEGFVCRDVHLHSRIVVNRKTGSRMQRRWIQAVFCMPPGPPSDMLIPRGPRDGREAADSDINDDVGLPPPTESRTCWDELFAAVPFCIPPTAAPSRGACRSGTHVQVGSREFHLHGGVAVSSEELTAAKWLASHPDAHSRRVLDIGSGVSGVCGLASTGDCAAYVFLYPDASYERCLRASLQLNSCRIICERLRLVSVEQLCSHLCTSHDALFDCLVLRMADCSRDRLRLAKSLLKSGGLLVVLVPGHHDWSTELQDMQILMHDDGVVCAKLA